MNNKNLIKMAVDLARLKNRQAVRLKRLGFVGLAYDCRHKAMAYLRHAKQLKADAPKKRDCMYVIDQSYMPWTCLPESLDTSNLVDVSVVGDRWGKFVDANTGEVHDCAEYRKQCIRTPV